MEVDRHEEESVRKCVPVCLRKFLHRQIPTISQRIFVPQLTESGIPSV